MRVLRLARHQEELEQAQHARHLQESVDPIAYLIRDVTVTTIDNSVKVYGKLHAKGDFPFATEDSPVTTPEDHIWRAC